MNDIHATILETFFFGYIDRNIGADETPLFTRTHEGEPLSECHRPAIPAYARRSGSRHRSREAGGGAVKRDIYEAITERFIEQLKRGTVPWQKPWFAVQNIVSRKPYRGINALLLGSTDYQSPFWISFKQALDLGGHVKKGEKSTPVIYYKILEKRDEAGNMMVREDGRPARIPFVRWANVFNLDQTEGIPAPEITTRQNVTQPHEKAAAIVENAKLCPIHHGGFAALYSRTDDVIRIPAPTTFHSQEDYYHTLYHEMTHATGHGSRLDREGITQHAKFGSDRYSKEELVAELGAAFLSNEADILDWFRFENSAAYLASWIRSLKTIPA